MSEHTHVIGEETKLSTPAHHPDTIRLEDIHSNSLQRAERKGGKIFRSSVWGEGRKSRPHYLLGRIPKRSTWEPGETPT